MDNKTQERIKAHAEHNEKVFEDTMQRILNIASWADDPYKSTLIRVVSTAKEQWKSGKEEDEKRETCGICKERPVEDGLTVCNDCYENFDGDRRGFWKSDVYQ